MNFVHGGGESRLFFESIGVERFINLHDVVIPCFIPMGFGFQKLEKKTQKLLKAYKGKELKSYPAKKHSRVIWRFIQKP